MEFRTIISIPESHHKFDFNSGLFFIGSCFAENIGNKLIKNKFNALSNPFGVLYNPASVCQSLNRIIDNSTFNENDFFLADDLYKSFHLHSSFAGINSEILINEANQTLNNAHNHLKQAEFIFITLGTSWIYKIKESGLIAANCHKKPSDSFERILLSEEDSFSKLSDTIVKIKKINPNIKIVFSISPIRHLKDGALENQISKSLLFSSIKKLQNKHIDLMYFPAYEIMMDELRDYRFYAADMIHPSETAISYILERFMATYTNESTINLCYRIEKVFKALSHKPFNKETQAYKNFVSATLKMINEIKKELPNTDFEIETKWLKSGND